MKSHFNFTIGADPEFFITDKNGNIESAEGLIGGTKNKPRKFDDRGFFMQEDNVMVEFNIPPASTKQQFSDNMEYALEYLETFLDLMGYKPYYKPSALFSKEQLETPGACMFGCSPEYNVYTQSNNPTINAKDFSYRFAGGHVHIGYDFQYEEDADMLIKALDITLGLPALFLDPDTKRREAYGKAGSCRFTSYGLEYRVLSNFWLKMNGGFNWVYEGVEKAFLLANTNPSFILSVENKVQTAIDTLNKKQAKAVMEMVASNKQIKVI
jgi:hypothetical protein